MRLFILTTAAMLVAAGTASAQAPAARQGDTTNHGGAVVTGLPTVLIGGRPAARVGDNATCPQVTPGLPPIPHVGGPVITGSATVFIGGQPAARVGDTIAENGAVAAIASGAPTVMIGN